MYQIVYVIMSTVRFIVIALEVMMLARAVVSWFPIDEDHPIINFLYTVTEPVIMPVRALLDYFGWFEGLPIDMAFMITFILLSIVEMLLSRGI